MEAYNEEKRNGKRCIYQKKKKVNQQFGEKLNQDINGNKKLFLKEVSKSNLGKLDSCSKIKERKGRLALGGVQVRRIWKESA